MRTPQNVDVVVVGGGPAGLSAALILGRARRTILVCDDGQPRNARSHALHGFLTRDGEHPQQLRAIGFDQLRRYGIEVRALHVADAASVDGHFTVHLEGDSAVTARALLLATGVDDDVPAIDGLDALYGRSVFHCPYCDGWEVRDQPLGAYGAGANGVKLAVALSTWSRDVVLFTGGGVGPSREDRATLAVLGISVRPERVVGLEGTDGQLERVVLAGGASVARRALFFKTAARQRSPLAARLGCELTPKGVVRTNRLEGTGVPGLYVAGDASEDVQLAIVAAAEGAKAGFAIDEYLRGRDVEQHVRQARLDRAG
jgi:thioredoxin reductase